MTDNKQPSRVQIIHRPMTVTPEWIDNGEGPQFYVNNTGLNASPFDVTLQLGQMIEATADRLVVRELARVIMSPQHAKALYSALGSIIATYEATIGTIPGSIEES